MAYGRIIQGVAGAGLAAVTHNLGTATHCTFGVQDLTNYGGGAGTFRTLPRFWTSAKGANADAITDDTVAGGIQASFMSVSAHSLVDVGPITNGITRTVVSPFVTTVNPGARSLHYGVPLTIQNGAAASPTVTITHGLQTANVIVIAFPTSNPLCTTAATLPPMVVVQNIGAATATTCQIQGQTQNAIVTSAGPNTVTFDIMVLARKSTNAPWSRIMRRHGQGTPFIAGDDYGAGDRAQTGVIPSYGAMYTNIDDIAVGAGGTVYTHNIGDSTLLIALFEQIEAVGAVYNTLGIVNSATATTTATLLRGNEFGNPSLNVRVAFFRPYSVICLPT